MGYCIVGQVENPAIATVFFRAQTSACHLQIQSQTHRRAGDDDAGCVGEIKALGGDEYVDQHFDGAILEPGYSVVPVLAIAVAEDNRRRYARAIEHRDQIVRMVYRNGVSYRRAVTGMFLPELQYSRCHHIGTVLIGLLDSGFRIVPRAVNRPADDVLFWRGDYHLRPA